MNSTCKLLLLTAGIMIMAISRLFAQYEYLSILDYQNLTVNRLGNIPGVTWVTVNSTYDQNHQRFFFQGNATGATPFNLYTMDAPSATVLSSPVCPSGGIGSVLGLEYDNATDTLYSLYSDGAGNTYFSWIDPATGIVHPIKIIPSFGGFNMSAFDTKDHWYIVTRGTSILLAPSVTGIITTYEWTPVTGLANPAAPQTIAMPAITTTYQLLVTTDKGCHASRKRTIVVYTPLQIPNAFTPNGDGRNDIFRIPPSIQINLLNFSVYNRWGQRVFMTTNSGTGWDGTINGQPQPSGTYVWEIEYQDILTRKSALAKGTVMLVR